MTTHSEPRQVFKPPRPEREQLPPTLPPTKGAILLLHLEQGIQETVEAISELGLDEQLDSVEETLTKLERQCFTNHTNTDNTGIPCTVDTANTQYQTSQKTVTKT